MDKSLKEFLEGNKSDYQLAQLRECVGHMLDVVGFLAIDYVENTENPGEERKWMADKIQQARLSYAELLVPNIRKLL